MSRHATRDAIARYLQMSGGRRAAWAIVQYMLEYHGTQPHTTRQMLYRLTIEGLLCKPRWGYYQWAQHDD